jgi:predicted TIM-barrel fold metal-dependent hydrolase
VVLSSDDGLLVTANVNHFVGQALGVALNRWTEEEWLTRDERLYGLIAAVCSLPEEAAAEIRRSGENPRMIGIVLGSAGLGSPLGHPAYHAIYEAAAELELPIVLQAGVDATENAVPTPIAGGLPATAGEYRALSWHSQAAHVSSLIMQGVFDRFPTLQVLLSGAGAVWFPGHLWRMDHRFMATRGDGRWLKRRPIDYIDRFMFSTFRLERPPRADLLGQALSAIPGIEKRLVYASGFPDEDSQDPETALEGLPETWRPAVLRDNALDFFRWPDRPGAIAVDAVATAT